MGLVFYVIGLSNLLYLKNGKISLADVNNSEKLNVPECFFVGQGFP